MNDEILKNEYLFPVGIHDFGNRTFFLTTFENDIKNMSQDNLMKNFRQFCHGNGIESSNVSLMTTVAFGKKLHDDKTNEELIRLFNSMLLLGVMFDYRKN